MTPRPPTFLLLLRWLGLLAMALPLAFSQSVPAKKNVLILHSYHEGFQWTDDLTAGILRTLKKEPFEVGVWIEHLDTKRNSMDRIEGSAVEDLKRNHANRTFDLIISTDDDALAFLLDHRDSLFGRVPTVFCGVSGENLLARVPKDTYTGVIEIHEPDAMLQTMLALFPRTSVVAVVNENSRTGRYYRDKMTAVANRHKNLNFVFLDGSKLTFDEILERLAELPKNAITIATMFNHDAQDRYTRTETAAGAISSASPGPTFSPNSSELGDGTLGGNGSGGREHGAKAAELALKILQGASASALPITSYNYFKPVFDYGALKRWDLAEGQLPASARVVNRPPGFLSTYARNKGWFWFGFTLIGLELVAITLLIIQISMRKSAEQSLLESQRQLMRSQEIAKMGSWQRDYVTDELEWSDEVFRLYGLEPGAFQPTWERALSFIHPEDRERIRHSVERADERRTNRYLEYRIIRADGEVRYFRTMAEWQERTGGRPKIAGVVQDVTDQKQMEAQLHHVQRVESIGNLAGGLAHDFNNLLTVINGYSQIILSRLNQVDPIRKPVEEIFRAGERAADLTRKLLAFSRKQLLQPKMLNVNDVVTHMEGLLKPLLGDSVFIDFRLAGDLKSILADRTQLEQVIVNLATNARDAMPSGGTFRVSTQNESSSEYQLWNDTELPPGDYVTLEVTDTGEGMDEDTLLHIFEPFFTTKEVGRGTGLGLSSVYGIVQQSGGHIAVRSQKGRGTRFTLIFPASDAAPEAVVTRNGASAPKPASVLARILVVEDEPQVREIATQTLLSRGYEVISKANARDAIEVVKHAEKPFDLLVTDVVLPGLNGPQLAEALRARSPGLRVLFVSGFPGEGAKLDAIKKSSFMTKPLLPAELTAKVEEILATPAKS